MASEYYLIDPTRNITILVNADTPQEQQPEVAAELMRREPAAEQTGFVSLKPAERDIDIELRMAGGEFCGNATMSAAVLFCSKARLQPGDYCEVAVRASGAAEPVKVQVEISKSAVYHATVAMPAPTQIQMREFCFDGTTCHMPIVHFEGISHIIAEKLQDRDAAEAAVKQWCEQLQLPGLGIMFFDEGTGRVDPLVYVPAAGTVFWESSCASGTTAIGAYLAQKTGKRVQLELSEPGGALKIAAGTDGSLLLSGHVRILKNAVSF